MTTSLTSLSLPAVVSQLRVLLPTDKHAALDSVLNEHSETGGVSVRELLFQFWKSGSRLIVCHGSPTTQLA